MWLTLKKAGLSLHDIQVFTAEGEFIRMFERRGQGRCMWLTLKKAGLSLHDIQVFTADGEFIRMFERRGQGRLSLPSLCEFSILPYAILLVLLHDVIGKICT